jgi:hypothetical protein
LLAFVWAGLPVLPCCHELGGPSGDEAGLTAVIEHVGHHGALQAEQDFGIDHGENHCEEGSVADTDPPCSDIEKTSNDLRPVHFLAALVVATLILPAPDLVSVDRQVVVPRSSPPRRRPLHLEKSVLLI